MAGGRYLMAEGALYNPQVYSFLEGSRDFINYFWGFQWLAWTTWSIGGEFGLILVKSALLLTCAWFSWRILIGTAPAGKAGYLQLIVFALVIGVLCYRGFSLRPHLVSYVMIPVFIYLLGQRRDLYPLLPILTVAWINLHGVEWIVGAMICGCFFLQALRHYVNDPSQTASAGRDMIWIAACLPAMFLNPNGFRVLLTPFAHNPDIGLFILELNKVSLIPVIDLSQGIQLNGLLLILLAFQVVAAMTLLRRPVEHSVPLLLAAGGLVLLLMGKRFIWEWMLLSLPLVAAGIKAWRQPAMGIVTATSLPLVLGLLIFTFWPAMKTGWQHYPFHRHSLPYGTTEFIRIHEMTGRYAITPSYAGYVEFVLAPDVQIHMDMQFPPFSNLDYYNLRSAMQDDGAFRRYVNRYRPEMIGAMKANQAFPDATAREQDYLPVFFDNRVVLYVDARRFPDLVSRYAINAVNPFDPDQVDPAKLNGAITELEAMLAAVDVPEVRLTLTGMLVEARRLELAGVYLDSLQQKFPDNLSVAYYQARIAHMNNNCSAALPHYERALAAKDETGRIHREAADCYFLTGNQRAAFHHLSQAINPYRDSDPDAFTYYQFALSAIGAGEDEEAIKLLKMIRMFDPQTELGPGIDEILEQLGETSR